MYKRYFGLTEKPFAIALNPKYLFMSERHREALAHLLYGVSGDGCIMLLTGDVGTGKTTVCRCLTKQLPEKTDIAIILNPKLTILEFLATICEELSIPVDSDSLTIKTYIDNLNSFLLKSHAKGRSTALIIDEAQNLDMAILEQLRLLTNLETDTHKLLQIVLLGQPELLTILSKPELTQINQRITSRYHLKPLLAADVHKYIQHRIRIAGRAESKLFSPSAIKHIVKVSKGTPRLINILCHRALMGAYAENRDHVDLKIMKKAASEVTARTIKTFFSPKRLILALVILLLAICLPTTYYFAWYDTNPQHQQQTTTSLEPSAITESNETVKNPEQSQKNKVVTPKEESIQIKKLTTLDDFSELTE